MSKNNDVELVVFDTGALIQIHTQERFSHLALSLYQEAKYIGICNLVVPEIAGATGAMVRNKSLSKLDRKKIQSFLLDNLENWLVLPVSRTVCKKAFDLCQNHPLKGADAVHLAATLEKRGGVGGYNPPVFKPGIHGLPTSTAGGHNIVGGGCVVKSSWGQRSPCTLKLGVGGSIG